MAKTTTPYEDALQVMDEFAKVAETLAGMRAQIIAQGFSEEQASELVVLMFKQSVMGGGN